MSGNTAIDERITRLEECFRVIGSFLYFVASYCWIEAKDSGKAIRFELWPEQERIIPKIIDSLLVVILKARQLGLTWLVAAYCLWLAITRPLQLIVIVSSKEDTAKEFLGRIKFMLARLPSWMVPKVARETTEELEFEHTDETGHPLNSVIKSLATTKSGAQSKTPTLLVIDEAHESRDVGRLFAASKPGIEAAGGKVIVIANSVKDTGGWPWVRAIFVGAMRGINDFVPVFLPWWAHPGRSREIVTDETGAKMPRFKLEQIRGGMDAEDFSQHYPETEDEAISILGGSYFGTTLKRHNKTRKGILGTLTKNRDGEIEFTPDPKGIIEVWRFPYYLVQGWDGEHWSKRYCGGSDVSEGLGQSFSVLHMLDRHLDEFVCRIRSNRIDAHTWADQLHLLGEWYCNATEWTRTGGVRKEKALLCVERTGAGQTTIKRLKDLGANQYLQMVEAQQGGGHTKQYGWQETQQAKQDLSEDLRNWFRTMKGALYDAVLLDEASTWIKHEGSMKLGPEEGHLGDCVIAAGLSIQASHFLGAGPQRIKAPDVGWMARMIEEKKVQTGWTV
jgi:hypothetical protein